MLDIFGPPSLVALSYIAIEDSQKISRRLSAVNKFGRSDGQLTDEQKKISITGASVRAEKKDLTRLVWVLH